MSSKYGKIQALLAGLATFTGFFATYGAACNYKDKNGQRNDNVFILIAIGIGLSLFFFVSSIYVGDWETSFVNFGVELLSVMAIGSLMTSLKDQY